MFFHGNRLASYRVVRRGEDHQAHARSVLFQIPTQCLQVDVAFERGISLRIGRLRAGHVSASAPAFSMFARVVSKCICRSPPHPGPGRAPSSGGTPRTSLVGRDDVETCQLAHHAFEVLEAGRARIGFVAQHDARPLRGAHCGGPRVREEVEGDLLFERGP